MTRSNASSRLRAPDPTLTGLLHDPEGSIVSVQNIGRGPAVAHLWQPGECDPYDDFARMYGSHARWFAVPCRECFPDAPEPGNTWTCPDCDVEGCSGQYSNSFLRWQTEEYHDG